MYSREKKAKGGGKEREKNVCIFTCEKKNCYLSLPLLLSLLSLLFIMREGNKMIKNKKLIVYLSHNFSIVTIKCVFT